MWRLTDKWRIALIHQDSCTSFTSAGKESVSLNSFSLAAEKGRSMERFRYRDKDKDHKRDFKNVKVQACFCFHFMEVKNHQTFTFSHIWRR